MKIDLLHNKIIKENITDAFTESFVNNFLPILEQAYPTLSEIQMYEDHISDGFAVGGYFYYPLTLVFDGAAEVRWIRWNISDKKNFDGSPYTYVGIEPIVFELLDGAPDGFEEKIAGRAFYFEGGYAKFNIQSVSDDKTFLSGKYSQSFIDELNRQISQKIEKTLSVDGIEDSTVELILVFAPGTYMEHIVENTTYRRLLMTARGCSARDLWIKWTSKRGDAPLSVSDHVSGEDVAFELAEDVSHKIREKEYRFLVRTSAERYQAAMGRKNITEWRDLIKRALKRGELVKIEASIEEIQNEPTISTETEAPLITPTQAESDDITRRLEAALGTTAEVDNSAPAEEAEPESDDDYLANLLRNVIGASQPITEPTDEPVEEVLTEEPTDEPVEETVTEEPTDEPVEEVFTEEPVEEFVEEFVEEVVTEEPVEETVEEVLAEEPVEEPIEEVLTEEPTEEKADDEAELRRRIEAELREQFRREMEEKAKLEAEALRIANENLRAENERLATMVKKAEEERLQSDAEEERLRRELEEREIAEEREKQRLAEAARLAIAQQQKRDAMQEEKLAEQERAKREEERLREERARAQREAEERRLAEERMRAAAQKKQEEAKSPSYTYVSKTATLLFIRPIDPNITKRIHEIILTTIKYFHKEDVYIKIKATIPDSMTVVLHFVEIPQEENELLINIIKVLGKSNLGITKVYLE